MERKSAKSGWLIFVIQTIWAGEPGSHITYVTIAHHCLQPYILSLYVWPSSAHYQNSSFDFWCNSNDFSNLVIIQLWTRSTLLLLIIWQFHTFHMLLYPPRVFCVCRVDGGVSSNDFLLQCLADIIQKKIYRPSTLDMTSRGGAFIAGLGANVWTSLDELYSLQGEHSVFSPRDNWSYYKKTIESWERAVRRSKSWYQSDN